MNRQKNVKKRYGLLLRLGFLALSIFILLRIVDFGLVFEHVGSIPPGILIALTLIAALRAWLTGLRWQTVNPDVSGQLSSWQYFRLTMISKPFSLIMPGALGGDFAKTAFALKAVRQRRTANLLAILVDRFVGLLSITLLGATALVFMSDLPNKRPFYTCFAVLAAGFASAILVGVNPWILQQIEVLSSRFGRFGKRLSHVLQTWKQAMQYFRKNPHRLVVALLLCLPIHGLSFATTYVLSRHLGLGISFFDVSAIQALVWVITAVPLTISGAGVREISLIYFLSQYGVEAEPATALSVYLYIVTVVLAAVGLLFLLTEKLPSPKGAK